MSLKHKTNQQVIAWVNASNASQGMKNQMVKTLTHNKFSGADLVGAHSENDLRAMGFGFASNTLSNMIETAMKQGPANTAALVQERVQAQLRARSGGNKSTKSFSIRYTYNSKKFTTKNKFTLQSTLSQVVCTVCNNEIGNLDADKTTLNYLNVKMTSKDHRTLAAIAFNSAVECVISQKVIGGMAALADDEKSEFRERYPDWNNKHFEATLDQDDLLYVKDDNLRVKMPCGHNFGPECIYQIIKMCVESQDVAEVSCPMAKCGQVWDFSMLIAAADLNESEVTRFSNVFTHRAIKNSGDTRICKGCSSIIERPENLLYTRCRCTGKNCSLNSDFCWICGEKWQGGGFTVCGNKGCLMERVNDILQKCPEKVLEKSSASYNAKCPIYRACPRCATLIEYEKECKHMKCFGCGKKFCFYCLAKQNDDSSWPCKGYGFQCSVAPRQKFK